MQLLPGFGGTEIFDNIGFAAKAVGKEIAGTLTPKILGLPSLPPPPTRQDEGISAARRKQMELDKMRKGRAASILTGSGGIEEGLGSVSRPAARAAQLLGD